jgi:3-oxoacyl-[acyl-carrier-protein] synthase II
MTPKPDPGIGPLAVTGMGCITPCGKDVRTFWASLSEGKSGIDRIACFETTGYDVHVAGEVKDFVPAEYGLDPKEARRLDRYVLLAIAAAREAIRQAGLDDVPTDPDRVGIIIGTGIGGIRSIETQMDNLRKKGPSRVSPLLVPSGTPDVPANEISILYGFKGPSGAVSTACSSGSDAIIAAARAIRAGEADVMIAGGAEAPVSELSLATFSNLKALSRADGEPSRVCRPFDKNRSGFVLAEGAGILVLESVEHARRRGAKILALLAGYGQTTDAYHKTAPDPTGAGAAKAIRQAMERARVIPEEVGYINAHGTSTPHNDPMETLAIKDALGEHARRIPVSSTKSMTGHLIGGAGAVEAIASVQAILTGVLPPTINYETRDPDCDLDYVPNTAIERHVDVVISNSFGFGGHNSSLLFRSLNGTKHLERRLL